MSRCMYLENGFCTLQKDYKSNLLWGCPEESSACHYVGYWYERELKLQKEKEEEEEKRKKEENDRMWKDFLDRQEEERKKQRKE